jgi:hypothetical protein
MTKSNSTVKSRFLLEWYLFRKNIILICSVGFTFFYFSTIVTRNLIFYYIPRTKARYRDISFELLPDYEKPFLQNMFQGFIFTLTVIYLIIPVFYPKCHQVKHYGVTNFIILYLILLICHVFRDIGFNLTRVGSPTTFCMNLKDDQKPQSLLQCFYKFNATTCGDLIFSGHNANLIVISTELINGMYKFLNTPMKWLTIIVFALTIFAQGFFSVLTRRYWLYLYVYLYQLVWSVSGKLSLSIYFNTQSLFCGCLAVLGAWSFLLFLLPPLCQRSH